MICQTTFNSTQKSSQICSQVGECSQSFTISNVKAKGNITIHGNQTQNLTVNYNCIQTDTFNQTVSNDISNKLYSEMTNNLTADIMTQLENTLKTKAKTGWGSMFPATADSAINQKVNDYIQNNSDVNIKNLLKIRTFYNILISSFSNALQKTGCNQIANWTNIQSTNGSIDLSDFQSQSVNIVAKVIQQTQMDTKLTNDITNDLDLTVNNDAQVKDGTSTINYDDTSATSEGIDKLLQAIFGPIEELLKLLGLAGTGVSVISSLSSLCFCFIIVLLIVVSFIK